MKTKLQKAFLALLLLLTMTQKTKNAAQQNECFWADAATPPPPKPAPQQRLVAVQNGIRLTCYNLHPAQTDNTPLQSKWFDYRGKDTQQYYGKHIAISRDLKRKFHLTGGDTVYIATSPAATPQPRIVTDVTNARWRKTIDQLEAPGTAYRHKNGVLFLPLK